MHEKGVRVHSPVGKLVASFKLEYSDFGFGSGSRRVQAFSSRQPGGAVLYM
jgi:hypothetical protein